MSSMWMILISIAMNLAISSWLYFKLKSEIYHLHWSCLDFVERMMKGETIEQIMQRKRHEREWGKRNHGTCEVPTKSEMKPPVMKK